MVKKTSIHAKAIDRWGEDIQMVVAVEECSELIKAITKIQREGATRGRLLDLVDEMADVQLSINCLAQMFDVKDDLKTRLKEKYVRLEDRINDPKRITM